MAATDPFVLSDAQGQAVADFATALMRFQIAQSALEEVGLTPIDALRALPGAEEGRTLYDELPAAVRMLL